MRPFTHSLFGLYTASHMSMFHSVLRSLHIEGAVNSKRSEEERRVGGWVKVTVVGGMMVCKRENVGESGKGRG